jgi:hypothetical protein
MFTDKSCRLAAQIPPLFPACLIIAHFIFIEQNLGPHIEQKWAIFAPSAGRVWSW